MVNIEKENNETPINRDKKIAHSIFDYMEIIVFSICFVFLVFTFLGRISVVSGNSMNQTLSHGDTLVVSSLPYTPKQGDIVVFRAPYSVPYGDEHLVKRVIATENQTIDIDFSTWTVTVDGQKIDESDYLYLSGFPYHSEISFPYTVPEGKVFLMGDNRYGSHDSRTNDIGAVDVDYIVGPAVLRLFPINKFGFID